MTLVIIAATAFGCRTTNERNAYVQLSEAMVVLDQAKVVMSAVEDPELNAAPLDAWMHPINLHRPWLTSSCPP